MDAAVRTAAAERPRSSTERAGGRFLLVAGLLALVLLGLALRLARLDFQPLWWDEGYSAWFATHSLGQMVSLTAADIHPPLYYALLHLWILVAGPGPVSLRLVSVAAGLAAIPLIYAAAKRILGSGRAALLAAFLLAINPLHVYYSQEVRMYGLVALLSTGIVWSAWEILEKKSAWSWRMGIAYVALTTLALDTQYYAVFLPIGLTVYALWTLRKYGKALLRWFALQIIVALLYLPWVIYAGPRLTLYVSQKVVQDADRPLGFVAYFARHLSAFAAGHLEGSLGPWWPLALVLLVPVVIGLLIACRQRGEVSAIVGKDEGRANPIAFLGTVLLVALFLGWVIGLRYPFFPDRGERLMLLALPPFVMLVTEGLDALIGRLAPPAGSQRSKWLAYVALALFVVFSAVSLAAFYTVPRYPGDDYRPLIARTVEQGLPGDTIFAIYPWQVGYWRSYAASGDGPTAVLTPETEWGPALQATLDQALRRGRVWFPAHLALGAILETQVEQYLGSRAIPFANTWYGPGTRLSGWQGRAESEGPASPVPTAQPLATYALPGGGQLALLSATPPLYPVPAANAVAPMALAWEADSRPDLAVSVRLVDDLGQIWAQNDYEPLGQMVGSPESQATGAKWQAADQFGLLVPAGTPPGRYGVELVVLPVKGERPLPAQVSGQESKTSLRLSELQVMPAGQELAPERLPVTERRSIDLGDGLRFLGYTVDTTPLAPGDLRRVNLFWQATAQPKSDYTAFVQLLGKDGSPVAAWEAAPGAAYPTSSWAPATLMRTQAFVRPSAELGDGRYPLIAGLYRPADGARLKTPSGKDSLDLGSLTLKARPRQTTPPRPQMPADATFGSIARLVGYDPATHAGSPAVTLHWEALGASDRPYTVFVHLLDEHDKVVGFGDSEPGDGAYPTTGWRKGEYLADAHRIDVPAISAGSRIAVGLYDPATGQRLLTADGQDHVVLPLK